MMSLLMAGLAWCSGSWMVDGPWGTGKMSLAGVVLPTLLVSYVCFEQIFQLSVSACLLPFSDASLGASTQARSEGWRWNDRRPLFYRRMLAGDRQSLGLNRESLLRGLRFDGTNVRKGQRRAQ